MENAEKIILSLFDYSGAWSQPYRDAGYQVVQLDLQHGQCMIDDILPWCIDLAADGVQVHGILAAPPCTEFANSGARWWRSKEGMPAHYTGKNVEFSNRLEEAEALVACVLFIVELLQPVWWAVENPKGRIRKQVPEIGWHVLRFQPCDFGDPWTKETYLYGSFNADLPTSPVAPRCGSMAYLTSSSNKNKRTATPSGFSRAFFQVNR